MTDEKLLTANLNHSQARFLLSYQCASWVGGLELTPVLRAEDAPTVVHGTNRVAWEKIREEVSENMYSTVSIVYTH